MPPVEDMLKDLESDEFFTRFINQNSCNNTNAEIISQSLTVAQQLEKLSHGLSLLDEELQKQVLENHEDLLSQVSWIEKLESVLAMMSSHVQSLFSGIERLQARIAEPYQKMEINHITMSNIIETVDLLQRVARIQVICKRLVAQLENDPNDVLKASWNIHELEQLLNEKDLFGIDIIAAHKMQIKNITDTVESKVTHQLIQGLKTQKFIDINTSIQVLYNLNKLETIVNDIFDKSVKVVNQMIRDTLNIQTLTGQDVTKRVPGRAALPSPGNYATCRTKTWSSLEKIYEIIYNNCLEIEILEYCLRHGQIEQFSSKNKYYIDVLQVDDQNITQRYWQNVTDILAKQLSDSADKSTSVREVLELEYPKFLRIYMDLCKKLESKQKTENCSLFAVNKNVVLPFEKSYLSKSISKVLDPVRDMFLDGLPNAEKVDMLIRVIAEELSVALVHPTLTSTVAKNITKCVKEFCFKCDEMVATDKDATQVISSCTSSQMKNIGLANLLEYFKTQLVRVTSNLGSNSEAAMIIKMSLASVDDMIANIIKPVLSAISKAICDIIMTMHEEDFSRSERKIEVTTSLYMRELDDFVSRCRVDYLQYYNSRDIIDKYSLEIAERCVELFIRHVSVLRPLGSAGRDKLVADCNQLESTISPLLNNEPHLLRRIRSFRSLLVQSPEEVLVNSCVGKTVPYSVALYLLFTHAPSEIVSPHLGAKWSILELSAWLDKNKERDRLEFIKGALESYCTYVNVSGSKTFHPIYPVMLDLMHKASLNTS